MDYLASGLLLSLSFYNPTSVSTDQLITWYFLARSVSIRVPLIDLRFEKDPFLRQVHISFIAGEGLLTEISNNLCCATA